MSQLSEIVTAVNDLLERIAAMQLEGADTRTVREELLNLQRNLTTAVEFDEEADKTNSVERGLNNAATQIAKLQQQVQRLSNAAVKRDSIILPDPSYPIVYGTPQANTLSSSATVALEVATSAGLPSSAETITAFVSNDQQAQLLEDRYWKKRVAGVANGQPTATLTATAAIFTADMVGRTVYFEYSASEYTITAYTSTTVVTVSPSAAGENDEDVFYVMGTIMNFVRLPYRVGSVGAVLVGEGRNVNPIAIRLVQEDSGGGGEYDQWKQVEPDDAGGWQDVAYGLTHTNTGKSVWESNEIEDVAAHATTGAVVWAMLIDGDETRYYFDAPYVVPDVTPTSDPIWLDKWYSIEAAVAWTDIDSRDWSGRVILISAYYEPGELEDQFPYDLLVEHYDSEAPAWAARDAHTWFKIYLNSQGFAQDMTRILASGETECDFHLRMNTDGKLQMKSESYNSAMSVRFSIITSSSLSLADEVVFD